MDGYIGTYASPNSVGVYRFTFDESMGTVEPPTLLCDAPDAKYAAVTGNILAAPVRRGKAAGILIADCQTGQILDELLTESVPACHLVWRNDYLFTANYHEGTVRIYRWADGKLHAKQQIVIAPKAGCHQCLFYGSTLLVPCLELDEIRLFDLERDCEPLGRIALPSGTGPRHGIFCGQTLYLVGERSRQLLTLHADSWEITSSTPIAAQGTSAAIRLSWDKRFLYVSTRGADEIAVFRIDGDTPERIQQISCGGEHPRDILLSPDGRFLLVINRSKGGLVSFALDPLHGSIEQIVSRAEISEGVSLCMAEGTDEYV